MCVSSPYDIKTPCLRMRVFSSANARTIGPVQMRELEGGASANQCDLHVQLNGMFVVFQCGAALGWLFHSHAKDVPSYVRAVKVGHKEDTDQKQLAELIIGETPRVVREAAERACDRRGG